MATLYVVATPIGNLDDLTLRALRILSEVDLILAEDTRVTKKLLRHYKITTPLLSYHQHSRLEKVDSILSALGKGKTLALVSDAGTPGISDPGNELVEKVIERLSDKVAVVPVPGPSALAAAASISGFPLERFLFLGFPPVKRKRQKFFQEILNSQYPAIFYESKYKILKSLAELSELQTKNYKLKTFQVAVCQELTKKFEKVHRGTIAEVLERLKKSDLRGEFVVIVQNPR
jgi:16S rRNA (cytidine1402-2'-O)-methyltransferase